MDLEAPQTPASNYATDATPLSRSSLASPSPKRTRARALTHVDRRSVAGKRIGELTETFLAALESQGREVTPALKLKVEQAAQLQAFAEQARGRWLRGESSDRIDGICTAERLAERAVKALGLRDTEPRKTLADVLASPPAAYSPLRGPTEARG